MRWTQENLARFSWAYSNRVAAVPKIARTFRREKSGSDAAINAAEIIEGAGPGGAQDRFELGEAEFDRIEVGTVRRQKSQARADAFNRQAHVIAAMGGEIVENHHVVGKEGRDQDLLDVREKAVMIDGPIDQAGQGIASVPEPIAGRTRADSRWPVVGSPV